MDQRHYHEEKDEGYFLEVDVQYFGNLHELHNDLPLLPEKIKNEIAENLVANLHDKTEYFVHTGKLKQALVLKLNLIKMLG